jgi:glycolate oxidase FAD binding subunit
VEASTAQDYSERLIAAVRDADAHHAALAIHGGNTKAFYGRATEGEPLNVSPHCGVVRYEPTELVITTRAGTLLSEVEDLLDQQGQMLPFEPPHFGTRATVGGCVAAGLSGPRRPYAGAVRDNLLGVEIINGKGERLKFGGEVMKNVAGYDLSRLMAGALGTLGVLLQVSFKVLPRPVSELTLSQAVDADRAIELMTGWARRPLPISATWHDGQLLYLRLAGGERGVKAAADAIGGDRVADGEHPWQAVREHTAPFFKDSGPLWRLSLPPATPMCRLPGACAREWSGALRWIKTDAPLAAVRSAAVAAGGHATLFRGGDAHGEPFQPLPTAMMTIHQHLKRALDPVGILNPGRMYAQV